jgi:RNA polymerase sigma-54 factor
MRLGLTQNLRAEQRLIQSPQMIQAMQVLQYPLFELKDRIDQELMDNVFLDIKEGPAEPSAEEAPLDASSTTTSTSSDSSPSERGSDSKDGGSQETADLGPGEKGAETQESRDRAIESSSIESSGEEAPSQETLETEEINFDAAHEYEILDDLERRTEEYRPQRVASNSDEESRFEAIQNAPRPTESLSEHLIQQLGLLDLDEHQKTLVEYVIYSLDSDGRLMSPLDPQEIQKEVKFEVSEENLEEAIQITQTLDPPGVGARTLEECLLLQLDALEEDQPLARELVQKHLENLSMNRLPRIARETGATIEEVKEAVEFLRSHLHPHPGSQFGDVKNQVIHPDVIVEEVEGRFEIKVEKGGIPVLQISPVYRRLLQESKGDPKVREYLKKKIESAKWFIDAVLQRQSTIERIATAIVKKQAEFLRRGWRYLRPLRMQDIADEVGVHISTVSRAVSGKFIQTPQGIFDMKRFFSAGTKSDSGEMLSQQAVKQKVQAIVDREDPKHPFSDDAIVHELEKEGIHIARRTVTKYRKTQGIPSSSRRKRY